MELTNEFDVPVPVDQAWDVLTDLEQIAPCLPGAQLQEVEGDEYRGVVKVKVGPITAQYKGKAHFVERDADSHKAILTASGRDTRGQGDATANITAQLTGHGDHTHVSLVTDLALTGKVAQFGRGVLADVSAKLMQQFLDNLESMVLSADGGAEPVIDVTDGGAAASDVDIDLTGSGGGAETEAATEAEAATETVATATAELASEPVSGNGSVRKIDAPVAEPVDLLDAAGGSVLKRLLPLVVVVVVGALAYRVLRRRRRA
jgi:carbon monoxide dehydrogenase subunit G